VGLNENQTIKKLMWNLDTKRVFQFLSDKQKLEVIWNFLKGYFKTKGKIKF